MNENDNSLTPEQEAEVERHLNQGMNVTMARAAVLGYFDEPHKLPVGHHITGAGKIPTKPLESHPSSHVRGFGDGELRDGELYKSEGALSDEQRETNRVGIAEVRKARGDLPIQAIQDDVERTIPIDPDDVDKSLKDRERTLNARLRTYFENKDSQT